MNMKIKLNENYKNLKKSYLFSEIAKRVKAYGAENPDKKIIRLGIGDVTLPLTKSVTDAMTAAVAEMGKRKLSADMRRSTATISSEKRFRVTISASAPMFPRRRFSFPTARKAMSETSRKYSATIRC